MTTAEQTTKDTATAATDALATDTVTVHLQKPITRGKQTIESVQLRKPNVIALSGVVLADLVRMQTDEVVRVLPRITEPTLTKQDLLQLDPADFMDMAGEVSNFFVSNRMRAMAEA